MSLPIYCMVGMKSPNNLSIISNYAQQNFYFQYDLNNNRLRFVRRKCTSQVVNEGRNEHKHTQIRELVALNSTIRDVEFYRLCGEPGHR
jgi:hypothetical protein